MDGVGGNVSATVEIVAESQSDALDGLMHDVSVADALDNARTLVDNSMAQHASANRGNDTTTGNGGLHPAVGADSSERPTSSSIIGSPPLTAMAEGQLQRSEQPHNLLSSSPTSPVLTPLTMAETSAGPGCTECRKWRKAVAKLKTRLSDQESLVALFDKHKAARVVAETAAAEAKARLTQANAAIAAVRAEAEAAMERARAAAALEAEAKRFIAKSTQERRMMSDKVEKLETALAAERTLTLRLKTECETRLSETRDAQRLLSLQERTCPPPPSTASKHSTGVGDSIVGDSRESAITGGAEDVSDRVGRGARVEVIGMSNAVTVADATVDPTSMAASHRIVRVGGGGGGAAAAAAAAAAGAGAGAGAGAAGGAVNVCHCAPHLAEARAQVISARTAHKSVEAELALAKGEIQRFKERITLLERSRSRPEGSDDIGSDVSTLVTGGKEPGSESTATKISDDRGLPSPSTVGDCHPSGEPLTLSNTSAAVSTSASKTKKGIGKGVGKRQKDAQHEDGSGFRVGSEIAVTDGADDLCYDGGICKDGQSQGAIRGDGVESIQSPARKKQAKASRGATAVVSPHRHTAANDLGSRPLSLSDGSVATATPSPAVGVTARRPKRKNFEPTPPNLIAVTTEERDQERPHATPSASTLNPVPFSPASVGQRLRVGKRKALKATSLVQQQRSMERGVKESISKYLKRVLKHNFFDGAQSSVSSTPAALNHMAQTIAEQLRSEMTPKAAAVVAAEAFMDLLPVLVAQASSQVSDSVAGSSSFDSEAAVRACQDTAALVCCLCDTSFVGVLTDTCSASDVLPAVTRKVLALCKQATKRCTVADPSAEVLEVSDREMQAAEIGCKLFMLIARRRGDAGACRVLMYDLLVESAAVEIDLLHAVTSTWPLPFESTCHRIDVETGDEIAAVSGCMIEMSFSFVARTIVHILLCTLSSIDETDVDTRAVFRRVLCTLGYKLDSIDDSQRSLASVPAAVAIASELVGVLTKPSAPDAAGHSDAVSVPATSIRETTDLVTFDASAAAELLGSFKGSNWSSEHLVTPLLATPTVNGLAAAGRLSRRFKRASVKPIVKRLESILHDIDVPATLRRGACGALYSAHAGKKDAVVPLVAWLKEHAA